MLYFNSRSIYSTPLLFHVSPLLKSLFVDFTLNVQSYKRAIGEVSITVSCCGAKCSVFMLEFVSAFTGCCSYWTNGTIHTVFIYCGNHVLLFRVCILFCYYTFNTGLVTMSTKSSQNIIMWQALNVGTPTLIWESETPPPPLPQSFESGCAFGLFLSPSCWQPLRLQLCLDFCIIYISVASFAALFDNWFCVWKIFFFK